MSDLRELLARRVEASRHEAERRQTKTGVFTELDERRLIHFTTTGRRSHEPREKWWLPFASDGDILYLLEEQGLAADWVRNVIADAHVMVEDVPSAARVVADVAEQARARELCAARFARVGLAVADLVERGLVVAFEPRT